MNYIDAEGQVHCDEETTRYLRARIGEQEWNRPEQPMDKCEADIEEEECRAADRTR